MPQQVRQFDLTKSFIPGESNDVVAIYSAGLKIGAVLVQFSQGPLRSTGETCGTTIDRNAGYVDRKVWHKERIGPWRDLAPLFAGMETGRAAVYDSELRVEGTIRPMRSEVYILCGTGSSWIVEYHADYPPDVEGSTWIPELIAATAPQS